MYACMQVLPDEEIEETEEAEEDDIDMTSRTLATQEKSKKTRKPNTPNKATKPAKANAINKSKKQSNSSALNLHDICSDVDVDESDKMDENDGGEDEDEDEVISISDPTEMISPSKISRNSLSQKRRILHDDDDDDDDDENCIDDINISLDKNQAEGNKSTKKLFRVELDSDQEMSGSESNESLHKDDDNDGDGDGDDEGGFIKEDNGPVKRGGRFRPPYMKVSDDNFDTKGMDDEEDGSELDYRQYKGKGTREEGDYEDEEEDDNNSDDSYGSIIDKDYDESYDLLEEGEKEEEEEEENSTDSGNMSNEENILNSRKKRSQVIDKSYTKQKRNKLSMRY